LALTLRCGKRDRRLLAHGTFDIREHADQVVVTGMVKPGGSSGEEEHMRISDPQAMELIETLPDHVASFDEPGIAQAVSSCQAAEVIEHLAALLSGQAKAVLQKVFTTTPALTYVLAKTEAQIQQRIAETIGHVEATMKGLTTVLLSLLHW
jgi:hypothetical protein